MGATPHRRTDLRGEAEALRDLRGSDEALTMAQAGEPLPFAAAWQAPVFTSAGRGPRQVYYLLVFSSVHSQNCFQGVFRSGAGCHGGKPHPPTGLFHSLDGYLAAWFGISERVEREQVSEVINPFPPLAAPGQLLGPEPHFLLPI